MQKIFNYFRLLLLLTVILEFPSFGNEVKTEEHSIDISQHAEKKEGFNTKDFIFDHIKDSYGWHILTFREHQVAIPLPIILYSKTSGLHIFMSSKFHHGHSSYEGFKIEKEGLNKGKIVEELADGSLVVPIDISITKNVCSLFISIIFILWIFISIGNRYKNNALRAPKGMQSLLEPVILFVRDEIAVPSLGKKRSETFLPYLLTVFFFIWFNNMLGLVPFFPGGANLTGNVAVTITLALFTFFITQFSSNKHYWLEIFNPPGIPWWLKFPLPLMPIIELLSVFTKPLTLIVRLFANISGGHIIALSFVSLIFIFGQMNPIVGYGSSVLTVVFLVFMTFLELLVAFIQAYVFTLLSALYFGMARPEHHGGGGHEKQH